MFTTEVAKFFDSTMSKTAIVNVWSRNIVKNVRNIRSAVEAGENPVSVPLFSLAGHGTGQTGLLFLVFENFTLPISSTNIFLGF